MVLSKYTNKAPAHTLATKLIHGAVDWAVAGFKDTLLRCQMKREVTNEDEKEIQPGVQA